MTDENRTGCEYGRQTRLQVESMEIEMNKIDKHVRETTDKIFERLNNWMPKSVVIAFTVMGTIMGALITGLITVLAFLR